MKSQIVNMFHVCDITYIFAFVLQDMSWWICTVDIIHSTYPLQNIAVDKSTDWIVIASSYETILLSYCDMIFSKFCLYTKVAVFIM